MEGKVQPTVNWAEIATAYKRLETERKRELLRSRGVDRFVYQTIDEYAVTGHKCRIRYDDQIRLEEALRQREVEQAVAGIPIKMRRAFWRRLDDRLDAHVESWNPSVRYIEASNAIRRLLEPAHEEIVAILRKAVRYARRAIERKTTAPARRIEDREWNGEAYRAFQDALYLFEPARGNSFAFYATRWIGGELIRRIADNDKTVSGSEYARRKGRLRNVVSMQSHIADNAEDRLWEDVMHAARDEKLDRAVLCLTPEKLLNGARRLLAICDGDRVSCRRLLETMFREGALVCDPPQEIDEVMRQLDSVAVEQPA